MLIEKTNGFFDREVERFADISAAQADCQNMTLKPAAVARLTFHLQIRHEMHLDRYSAGAMAFFAASAVDIEGKIARLDAQPLRLRAGGEQLADFVINFQIG